MKIIHTYIPVTLEKIDKTVATQMTLSALLAKKHYGKVVLYTNKETANIVRRIGIPYDEIIADKLDSYKGNSYTIPKMIIYAEQGEPFIHIDIDTFLFNHVDVKDDEHVYFTYREGLTNELQYNKFHYNFYKKYIKSSFELLSKLDKKFTKYVTFEDIYNTCFFGGYQHELISEASKYCLDIYNKNSQFIDSDYYNGVMIEQMMIPAAIKILKKDYMFEPIFNDTIPNTFTSFSKSNYIYPFKIESGTDLIFINNETELFNRALYNFNGFLHLNGYKGFNELIFIIVQKLLFEFEEGFSYIKSINKIFGKDGVDELSDRYHTFLKTRINSLNTNKII